jgi:hypothetical protein
VFENRVLRGIFGPRRDDVTGEWRKLRNEELNDLYCSPNIVQVIKSRRIRWAGHVARMGRGRGVYRILLERMGRPPGRSGQVRKISPTSGFDLRTVQPVASHCTDRAT